MSRHVHRFNQERRGIDLDVIQTSLTYEFSKSGLFRAMPIMAEQLAILQQRASTRCGKACEGMAIYNLQQQGDLEDQILPLEDSQDADAMAQVQPSIKVLMHGYRNAVSALPNKDPETQENLHAFKKCVDFPDETLRRLVNYTFAHCMSRQCLQFHHPNNFLSEILD